MWTKIEERYQKEREERETTMSSKRGCYVISKKNSYEFRWAQKVVKWDIDALKISMREHAQQIIHECLLRYAKDLPKANAHNRLTITMNWGLQVVFETV